MSVHWSSIRHACVRLPLVAALALALQLSLGGAAPAQAWWWDWEVFAREDFCLFDPVVHIGIDGKPVAVQVWLGVPQDLRAKVDQRRTNRSLRAEAVANPDGSYTVGVWATVFARDGASFPTGSVSLALGVPSQNVHSTTVTWGDAGVELVNSVRVEGR